MNEYNAVGISVGASKDAVQAAHRAILDILNAPRDEETVRTALRTFNQICEVRNATVSNCTVTVQRPGDDDWLPPAERVE